MPEPTPSHPSEMVGATSRSLSLTGETATAEIAISPPTGPLRALGAAGPRRVYLNIEDVEADRHPGLSYAVYLNLPHATDPERDEDDRYYVGNVTFFGIEHASDTARDHPGGHGRRHAFDVTGLVGRLRESGEWQDDHTTVSFVPLRVAPPTGVTVPSTGDTPTVRIGRVSLFYR